MDNRDLLDWLFETDKIHLQRGAIFDKAPTPLMPSAMPEIDAGAPTAGAYDSVGEPVFPSAAADRLWDRIDGMMLGLAIGDALGNTSEGLPPAKRTAGFGEIRDYLPSRTGETGLPSDETQLAFWTLERMLVDGTLEPSHLARCFARTDVVGVGRAVDQFRQHVAAHRQWHACGIEAPGNGALMRIAPVLIPHVARPSADLWADVAIAAMVTHNDPASTAACLAFVAMLWKLLAMQEPPAPEWWVKTYVTVARDLEGDTDYTPRGGRLTDYHGPVWRFAGLYVTAALKKGLSVRQACSLWESGAYLLETVPSALFILARHGDDPEEAIVRAVNDTRDNDTIASIVGAAVGALHGKSKLPARWVHGLKGRTAVSDDGRVFELLAQTHKRWVI